MARPLAIDLFCGLGGWSEALIAEGFYVVGFDIERHEYGDQKYPGQLVLQDVTTLHGSQFKDAALIVASPPCTEYSYMAMPWKRAKQIAAALRGHGDFPPGYKGSRTIADLNRLFDACFRIQREASEAAGRHIPLIVENVRGAVPWVGPARWNFGSFYLWGDVPALMPRSIAATKIKGQDWSRYSKTGEVSPHWRMEGTKVPTEGTWRSPAPGKGARFTSRDCGDEGRKVGGDWFSDPASPSRISSSKSPARKAASAMIAKIPQPLAMHIASTFLPEKVAA